MRVLGFTPQGLGLRVQGLGLERHLVTLLLSPARCSGPFHNFVYVYEGCAAIRREAVLFGLRTHVLHETLVGLNLRARKGRPKPSM